jgi:hypothetical protein
MPGGFRLQYRCGLIRRESLRISSLSAFLRARPLAIGISIVAYFLNRKNIMARTPP